MVFTFSRVCVAVVVCGLGVVWLKGLKAAQGYDQQWNSKSRIFLLAFSQKLEISLW